jgi:hypothetical protein
LPKSIKNRVLEAYVPSADFADELLHSSGLSLSPEDQKYIIRQLDDLPFVGIVVKNKDKGFALSDLADAYGPGTRFPKIIEVEEGHLEDGVRQAIKMYAEKNPEYAAKLSPDLRKEIFGIIDEQISEAADTISKKKFKGKYFALLGAAVALLGGVALYFRNKKKQKKEAR